MTVIEFRIKKLSKKSQKNLKIILKSFFRRVILFLVLIERQAFEKVILKKLLT